MSLIQIILLIGLGYSVNKLLHALVECVKTRVTVDARRINMAKEVRQVILIWDWRDNIPLCDINDALADVANGEDCPGFHEVDTGSDQGAVIVTSIRITVVQAQEKWEEWMKSKSIVGGKDNEN